MIVALLIYIDKEQHYSMLASVIQKASIYALLAVSLNLLNGFTGLFSLGQGGLHDARRLYLRYPHHPPP